MKRSCFASNEQTFSQASHELQASGGSQVDAGPLQLIVVQDGAGRGRVRALRHVAHLHWASS